MINEIVSALQANLTLPREGGGGGGHVRGQEGEDGRGLSSHVGPVRRGEQGGRLLLYRLFIFIYVQCTVGSSDLDKI